MKRATFIITHKTKLATSFKMFYRLSWGRRRQREQHPWRFWWRREKCLDKWPKCSRRLSPFLDRNRRSHSTSTQFRCNSRYKFLRHHKWFWYKNRDCHNARTFPGWKSGYNWEYRHCRKLWSWKQRFWRRSLDKFLCSVASWLQLVPTTTKWGLWTCLLSTWPLFRKCIFKNFFFAFKSFSN